MKILRKKALPKVLCLALAALIACTPVLIKASGTAKNVALTAAVYAETGDFYLENGFGPSSLHDNKLTTFFSGNEVSTPDKSEEIVLVLNGTYTVNSITLMPRGSNQGGVPVDFTLSLYDGSDWIEIDRKENNTANGTAYTKSDIKKNCTAVRLKATKLAAVYGSTGSNAKYALQLAEFQIMGVKADTKLANPIILTDTMNVAKGSEVLFDCPEWAKTGFPASKLVDGITAADKNFSTTNNIGADDVKEIYLTLDGIYYINEISLYPALQNVGNVLKYVGGFPMDYTVSFWNGDRWCETVSRNDVTVGNYEAPASEIQSVTDEFSVTETNAVRITVTKHSAVNAADTAFALRLAEIEVNGVKSARTDMDAPAIAFEAKNIAPDAKATASEDGKSATYLFDKAYTVSEVILSADASTEFPSSFEVSLWDGTDWRKIESKQSYDLTKKKLYVSVDGIAARALRITGTEVIPILSADKKEIIIHGDNTSRYVTPPKPLENAALGAKVKTEIPDWAVSTIGEDKLNDGILTDFATSSYVTDASDVKTVTLTLANAYKVNAVNLYPRLNSDGTYKANGGFPAAFKICVWDGEVWKAVKTVSEPSVFEGKYPVLSVSLDSPELCGAVRIETVTLGGSDNASLPYVLQLAEVEVLGEKSGETLAPPPEETVPENPDDSITEPEKGENAALNGAVDMKVPSWASSFPASKLTDGVTAVNNNFVTTEYVSNEKTSEEVIVTFGKGAYKIDRIKLYPRANGDVYNGGFPVDFKVSVWNGSKWTEVAARTGVDKNTAEALTLKINPTVCNAVKLSVSRMSHVDNSAKFGLQLAELEAWGEKSSAVLAAHSSGPIKENEKGTNAALGGTVSMDVPSWAGSFPGDMLVDGTISGNNNFATTEYVSDANTKQTVAVAFKNGAYKIEKIKLYPRTKNGAYNGGFPVDFKVSVWNGKNWVEVASKTGVVKNTAEAVSLSVKPTVCNAVKIEVTKLGESENAGKYTLQLAEIEAWGEKSSAVLAAPPISGAVSATATAVTIDNSRNLALNKPITASSDLSQYNAPVIKANDGNLSSYWASDDRLFVKGEAQWAEINLLNNFSVHTVILGARQLALGFPIDFKIEVYYDGKWIEAYSEKGFEANEKAGYTAYEFNFPAVIGNKVRVSSDNFRKVGTSNSLVISEIAVYGDSVSGNYVLPNENMITAGVGVTATTSMEDYDYYLIHLVDGSLTTGWSNIPSVAKTPQTVEVDIKCEVQLSEIQLKPAWGGRGFPKDFAISVYENGAWTEVYRVKDYPQPEDEAIQRFQFATKKCTKFRITAESLPQEAGLYVWKMNEILAYPSHTGSEFDPNRVDVVASTEKLSASEVLLKSDNGKETFTEVTWWKFAVGAAVALVAVSGCAAMLLVLKKRKPL